MPSLNKNFEVKFCSCILCIKGFGIISKYSWVTGDHSFKGSGLSERAGDATGLWVALFCYFAHIHISGGCCTTVWHRKSKIKHNIVTHNIVVLSKKKTTHKIYLFSVPSTRFLYVEPKIKRDSLQCFDWLARMKASLNVKQTRT